MKRNMKIIALAALSALALSGAARAADWPMWGGTPARNMVNKTEKNIPAEWNVQTGKNIKWHQPLGSQAYGNPVIAKGKVFAGTNNGAPRNKDITDDKGILMCFNESDGKFLWQAVHDKLPAGRVNDWPEQGICSSPNVENDRVYYVSNRAELCCADVNGFTDGKNNGPYTQETLAGPEDADFIWKLDMIGELKVFPHNLAVCSPLIIGDKIYIVTGNGVDEGHLFIPSPDAPSFICVDKNTGKVVWSRNDPGKGILHGQWSNPAYGEVNGKPQVFFPGGNGWIYAFTPDKGEPIWQFDLNPKDSVYVLGGRGTRNEIICTPIFVDGHVYAGVGQDPEHGEGPGHYYSIDASKTGDVTESGKTFQFDKTNRSMSTSAIVDGLIYVSDLSGYLHCLDQKTGEQLWEYDALAAIWGSPSVIDNKVFLCDEDGDVAILQPGRELKVIAELTLNNAAYGTAVAANGVLFLNNRSELYAISEGGK